MVIVVSNGTRRNTDEMIPIRCLLACITSSNVVAQVLKVQLYVVRTDVHTALVENVFKSL